MTEARDPGALGVTDVGPAAPPLRPRSGPLSWLARQRKYAYFLPWVPKDARILDLGCAGNWFKQGAAQRGWTGVTGLDLAPPADIVGNVFDWRELGIEPHSFDAVTAFEVLEHGDFSAVIHDLLKPSGYLFATTPVPRMDGVCHALERVGALQQRTSPHTHLTDLRELPRFDVVDRKIKALISQWSVLRPV
jgi:2-polyprenyl-3-methyl-5-hydroxy-6-metoxy-1,4-benzoquinol methylase